MRNLIVTLCLMVASVLLVLAVAPAQVERSMNVVLPHDPWPVGERAARLHATLRVADWHADSLLWKRDLTQRSDRGHVDLPRLREGNVALQVFTAVTKSPRDQNYEQNTGDSDNITLLAVAQGWPLRSWTSLAERALHQAAKLHGFAEEAPEDLVVVLDREGLTSALAAREDGPAPMIAVLGIEGMHALDGDIAELERLWDAGFRVFGLHHFFDNALGASLHGESGAGLTDFGREVVAEIERRGGIIDLAHSSPQVVRDVLAMTTRPPIVSHTGLHGACPSPRNLPDELMVAIAERRGLIGIGYWDGAVCDPSPASVAATLDYGRELLGTDALSLGSDYDGSTTVAFDASELAALTQGLLVAGFEEEAIRDVMGENTLRFLVRWLP
ncbi:MAG: membrane dipeptidase [Pseudomonadales bacterium]|nr:membrane dipeptidase [Pseudomonadales bacterium]